MHERRPRHRCQLMRELANLHIRRYGLKVRMLHVEVIKTNQYRCVAWTPNGTYQAYLRQAHYCNLPLCIGFRRNIRSIIAYYPTQTRSPRQTVRAQNDGAKTEDLLCGVHRFYGYRTIPKARNVWGGSGQGKRLHGRVRTRLGCLERDILLFKLPAEAEHWTLAANKPGRWSRIVVAAAQQCITRRFVTDQEKMEQRRAVRALTAQQLLKPYPSEGQGSRTPLKKGGSECEKSPNRGARCLPSCNG